MTEKISSVSSMPTKAKKETISRSEVERAAVRELVKAARARGEDLTGPDGLLPGEQVTMPELLRRFDPAQLPPDPWVLPRLAKLGGGVGPAARIDSA